MDKKPRLRFAPSPTGGLHIGGVRTVLYNYLFAKQHGGDFVLRIEDTDQGRFVAGAEEYIYETLHWCGLEPDESPLKPGLFGPYRQSERKPLYRNYADQLIDRGLAYYAFDTPEELEHRRKTTPNFQYNVATRAGLRNSLTLTDQEVKILIEKGIPYTIRIRMPENEEIRFTDMIRGELVFQTSLVDDKVLLKADGMPTYHLAVVVDDFLMEITHVFRGEEWLSSAPVHILLWKHLYGEDKMPRWAHLPLILKPDGNGKLSKRDGDRLGFPVFAMDWTDPRNGEKTTGFKERGFLPEAFINFLALQGWNDGTEQEVFSLEELILKFSIDRVHKGGAKFNYEKAKWFNSEWIKKLPVTHYLPQVKASLEQQGISVKKDDQLKTVMELVRDRCSLLSDFAGQSAFFFRYPATIDLASVQPKWNEQKNLFFAELIRTYELIPRWEHEELERTFKEIAAVNEIKTGELMLPLRIMLVGQKSGPGVFHIAEVLGRKETFDRIRKGLQLLS
jgi:glutamyl-tRNA synthetase